MKRLVQFLLNLKPVYRVFCLTVLWAGIAILLWYGWGTLILPHYLAFSFDMAMFRSMLSILIYLEDKRRDELIASVIRDGLYPGREADDWP